MVDWDQGRYETTAAELAAVAEDLIARAAIAPGERVLDIGCGTGNAALLAARAGGLVTGVDTAPRLLEVARARAAAERLSAGFELGDAQRLPFADASFDVVVPVFGIIFAPDAALAFAELVRVLRPGGRALLSAWTPAGAIAAMSGTLAAAVAAATQAPSAKRFPWHDGDAIAELAAVHAAARACLTTAASASRRRRQRPTCSVTNTTIRPARCSARSSSGPAATRRPARRRWPS